MGLNQIKVGTQRAVLDLWALSIFTNNGGRPGAGIFGGLDLRHVLSGEGMECVKRGTCLLVLQILSQKLR